VNLTFTDVCGAGFAQLAVVAADSSSQLCRFDLHTELILNFFLRG
jgi:hypothetical protein